jgi:hypothetical protein
MTSPINRMRISVGDGWRESSRPELLAACRLLRSADHRAARTCHPDGVVLDRRVEIAAATMFLEEGVEVGEQVSATLIAHTATLLGRSHCVNISDGGHYLPFGPRGSTVSGRRPVND